MSFAARRGVERTCKKMDKCKTCSYNHSTGPASPCGKCLLTHMSCYEPVDGQSAKADKGKLELALVPSEIIRDIAAVRMYGTEKYHDPDNWKSVSRERYRNAAYRHWLSYLDDPQGVDAESGLPHLWHLACNIAFLCEMERGGFGI